MSITAQHLTFVRLALDNAYTPVFIPQWHALCASSGPADATTSPLAAMNANPSTGTTPTAVISAGELAGAMDYAAVGQAVSRFNKRLAREPALLRQITKIQSQLSNVEM